MLLVSAENRGCVSRTVGGGPAAGSSMGCVAIDLPAGELVRDTMQLEAGAKATRQVLLRKGEHVSWVCTVESSLTLDFMVKLSSRRPQEVRCADRPVRLLGVDKCRMVKDRERGSVFQGYLDLFGEHADCVKQSDTCEPVATLYFEMDNGFSFFTAKDIVLQVSKQTLRTTQAHQTDASVPVPGPASSEDSMEPVQSEPAASASASTSQSRPCSLLTQRSGDLRFGRLQTLLKDAIRLCPADASAALEHLLAAQARLQEYAQQAAEDDLGPLSPLRRRRPERSARRHAPRSKVNSSPMKAEETRDDLATVAGPISTHLKGLADRRGCVCLGVRTVPCIEHCFVLCRSDLDNKPEEPHFGQEALLSEMEKASIAIQVDGALSSGRVAPDPCLQTEQERHEDGCRTLTRAGDHRLALPLPPQSLNAFDDAFNLLDGGMGVAVSAAMARRAALYGRGEQTLGGDCRAVLASAFREFSSWLELNLVEAGMELVVVGFQCLMAVNVTRAAKSGRSARESAGHCGGGGSGWAHRRSVLHVGLEPAGPGCKAPSRRAGPRHVAGEEDAFKAVMTDDKDPYLVAKALCRLDRPARRSWRENRMMKAEMRKEGGSFVQGSDGAGNNVAELEDVEQLEKISKCRGVLQMVVLTVDIPPTAVLSTGFMDFYGHDYRLVRQGKFEVPSQLREKFGLPEGVPVRVQPERKTIRFELADVDVQFDFHPCVEPVDIMARAKNKAKVKAMPRQTEGPIPQEEWDEVNPNSVDLGRHGGLTGGPAPVSHAICYWMLPMDRTFHKDGRVLDKRAEQPGLVHRGKLMRCTVGAGVGPLQEKLPQLDGKPSKEDMSRTVPCEWASFFAVRRPGPEISPEPLRGDPFKSPGDRAGEEKLVEDLLEVCETVASGSGRGLGRPLLFPAPLPVGQDLGRCAYVSVPDEHRPRGAPLCRALHFLIFRALQGCRSPAGRRSELADRLVDWMSSHAGSEELVREATPALNRLREHALEGPRPRIGELRVQSSEGPTVSCSIVVIAEFDGAFLVGVPQTAWHRTAGRRYLPRTALSRTVLAEVLAAAEECKGGHQAQGLLGMLQERLDPYGPSLSAMASEHFALTPAEEVVQGGFAGEEENRLTRLESGMQRVQEGLRPLLDGAPLSVEATAPSVAGVGDLSGGRASPAQRPLLAGLDPAVLEAGEDESSGAIAFGPRRPARRVPGRRCGPGGSGDRVSLAVVQIGQVPKAMQREREKKNDLEDLLERAEGSSGDVQRRALEDGGLPALMMEDFVGAQTGPHQDERRLTVRGWLEHRSHLQSYAGPIRQGWTLATIVDLINSGCTEQAKATALLAIAALD
ncbi:unnamed protein product, partial [Symbiodinium necroappetens]